MTETAVLLCGHGSRDPEAIREFELTAAALRGLANRESPFSSLSAFSRSNADRPITTSPRTSKEAREAWARSGSERIVRAFSVTSSPITPSPRVSADTNRPS